MRDRLTRQRFGYRHLLFAQLWDSTNGALRLLRQANGEARLIPRVRLDCLHAFMVAHVFRVRNGDRRVVLFRFVDEGFRVAVLGDDVERPMSGQVRQVGANVRVRENTPW